MKKNLFTKLFSPSDEFLQSLPYNIQATIPYILTLTFFLTLGFSFLTCFLFLNTGTSTASVSLIITILFFSSLFLLKKKKVYISSYCLSLGLIGASVTIAFFSTPTNSSLVPYRTAMFLTVMAIANQLLSLSNKQLYFFCLGELIIWITSIFTTFGAALEVSKSATIGGIAFCTLGLVIGNSVIIITNNFNKDIFTKAEIEASQAEEALTKMRTLISEAKEGFDISTRLTESINSTSDSVSKIGEIYRFLLTESSSLQGAASDARNVSSKITSQAQKMKEGARSQNTSITETSAAITEISANISNINIIASKRRAGMNETVENFVSQLAMLKTLVNQVEKVKESSEKIAAFVQTVDSIAVQTGLLAMNASIEAAHAGAEGKGFSVIAQEIRKLSEQTTKNASEISDTLKENAVIVQSTSDSVTNFASITEKSTQELRSTIQSIEEILAGMSEMDIGTQEVMKALQSIVDDSHVNTDLTNNVTSEVQSQNDSLTHISSFANALQERVSSLDDLVRAIKIAMKTMENEAVKNSEISKKMTSMI